MRVDGAPTMADLNQFLWDLQAAFKATYEDGLKNGDKFKRYAKNFSGEWDKALLERLGRVVTEGRCGTTGTTLRLLQAMRDLMP